MSKPLSLLFAVVAVLLMSATAISMSYNAWLALLFAVLTLFSIGAGFIVKARLRRLKQQNN
ncbi:hypothetical protein SAMN04487969_12434 [Paenibacillus algorifonticola]|uniref:DUF5325 family protein n=2 Tax=Paenibacillus TaxID=44249 RepID=A0A1I2HLA0_9BACL|nr:MULTISPECIES: DUF5325 family protein [Paenibacillus]ANY65271.1 hypothetical protein BBD42_01345 [Paenibacillus sp. BIHB 4019]KQO01052.1 hypothetical protein ASF12_14430 [Paenibacillus sp. Leaf72]SFF30298.1 hypothetical protein SAMN04487969_12434 [Paenibacillus algorifonticola]